MIIVTIQKKTFSSFYIQLVVVVTYLQTLVSLEVALVVF